ncbi:hypothetical protein L5220_04590 [Synechococcus sp. PCC 6716]|nr:hypothetical protein [Synechococcus sp. PCC 6716]
MGEKTQLDGTTNDGRTSVVSDFSLLQQLQAKSEGQNGNNAVYLANKRGQKIAPKQGLNWEENT